MLWNTMAARVGMAFVAIGLGLAVVATSEPPRSAGTATTRTDDVPPAKANGPNWQLLCFSEERALTSVVIVRKPAFSSGDGERITISDPEQLREFAECLDWPALRLVQDPVAGHLGTLPDIVMTITTLKDVVRVLLDRTGFYLSSGDSNSLGTDNVFFSWVLAHHIDAVLVRTTGKGLTPRDLRGLSGETYLSEQRAWYQTERNQSRGAKK